MRGVATSWGGDCASFPRARPDEPFSISVPHCSSLGAKRVREEHQDELKRNAAEVERMIKSHNSDIDRKDTEIKRLLSEADNERNRRDEELGKVKATQKK